MMTKDWVHGVGHFPVCQILLQVAKQECSGYFFPICFGQFCWDAVNPADFPFFNDCTAASTSLRRVRWSSSVSLWVRFSTDGSPLTLLLYSSEHYSVHRFSFSRSFVRSFHERSWIILAFSCFTVVDFFTSWYALLLLFFSDFLQSCYTVLLSSFLLPFSCTSWCCCSLPCIS